MDKRFMTVALFAGALALAGCGGDNPSTTAAGGGNGGNGGGGGGTNPAEHRLLELFPDAVLDVTTQTAQEGIIPAGGHYDFMEGNIRITCEGDVPCNYDVDAGRIFGTHSAKIVKQPGDKPIMLSGNDPLPTGARDPLSQAVLLEALKHGDSVETVWSSAGQSFDEVQPHTAPGSDPQETTDLTVRHLTDDIYWGHWSRETAGVVLTAEKTGQMQGTVFGGATRYKARPDNDVDAATYNSTDEHPVELYHKTGTAKSWTPGTGALALRANFKAGMIGGKITGIGSDSNNDVRLADTAIGSDGTFGAGATFSEMADDIDQTGEWKGAFFSQRNDRTNSEAPPEYVAGQFGVTRNAEDGKHAFTVHGAFGAVNDD